MTAAPPAWRPRRRLAEDAPRRSTSGEAAVQGPTLAALGYAIISCADAAIKFVLPEVGVAAVRALAAAAPVPAPGAPTLLEVETSLRLAALPAETLPQTLARVTGYEVTIRKR